MGSTQTHAISPAAHARRVRGIIRGMDSGRQRAQAFVDAYASSWERWDVEAFVALFSDDVIYTVHPTEQTVVGSAALAGYFEEEHAAQGVARVVTGRPVIDDDRVAVEFWARTRGEGEATIAGCLLAQLDPDDGRCSRFREYWFDIDRDVAPFAGWGD